MKKSGFTLAEVFIVIAILGLLVSIIVPSFMRAKKEKETKEKELLSLYTPLEKDGSESLTDEQRMENFKRERQVKIDEMRKRMAEEKAKKEIEEENKKEEERIKHKVKKMFEVNGVSFYVAENEGKEFMFSMDGTSEKQITFLNK